MRLEPIRSDEEYGKALARIERLIDLAPSPESIEAQELEVRTALVQSYETRNYPTIPPDPIEALLFRMEQQSLTQRDLIPFIGSRSKVSEVLSRKRPLTLSMIRALHFGLGIPASVLLKEPLRSDDSLDLEAARFPLLLMLKRGWIDDTQEEIENRPDDVLRRFFSNVGSLSQLQSAYKQGEHIRSGRSMDEAALLAWTVRVVAKSKEQSVEQYKEGSVNLGLMREAARLSVHANSPLLVRKFLAQNGIALSIEPHLPQTYLDGAAVIMNARRPVIGMTIRHDRLDNFWFTLMHELAHISCHLGSGVTVFYDDLDVGSQNSSREKEADAIAREALIPSDIWHSSPASKLPTPEAAEHLARKLGIHAAIAAGRIRYERRNYRLLPNLVGTGDVRRCFPEVNWSLQ